MAIRCPNCGAQYDVTLFTFDRRLHCDCGAWVDLAVGHQETGDRRQETGEVAKQAPQEVTMRRSEEQRREEETKLLAAIKDALFEDHFVDHDTIVENWRRNANSHDDQNYEFLRSLKFRDHGFDPDKLAADLHERAFQMVDCTRCANCCKTLDIRLSTSDAERIALHLGMAVEAFVQTYLTSDEAGVCWFRQQPCPFLTDDNRCRIYSVRPTDCQEYPFTDKEGFVFRTKGHANRALTCPAVFWIIEEMRNRSVIRTKQKTKRRP
jgi:uncharacterized protein